MIAQADSNRGDCEDIILEGGTLLSMVEGQSPLENVSIVIRGESIADIRVRDPKSSRPRNAQIIDARETIIMPGLVNAHGHTAMTLFRGLADDLPLKEWLFEKIFPAEARYLKNETVYWGSLLGCIEMIASGTTTVSDGYFFQDATAEAFDRAGMRALAAQGVIDFPAPGVPDPRENLKAGKRFIEKWLHFSDRIRPGLFCHSLTTCSESTLRGAMEISQAFSLPLQIHLSETSQEVNEVFSNTGRRPAFYLDDIGVANDHLIAVHAVHLDEAEMHLLAERKTRIVHVPESNMKLASGAAKTSQMLKTGLKVALGTDGCASNNNLDLFQEMGTAAKLGKVSTSNPVNMDAATVMKMATVWGAEVLGLEKDIGTIEVGKKADIIIIDLEKPHLVPFYNPFSSLVYSANGADVRDVIINGRIVMRDRKFQSIDTDEIMAQVKSISERIKRTSFS